MSIQVLTTKLYVPSPRAELVHRIGLVEQLNRGFHRKLTLISAPAGFGKTTLVAEWAAARKRPFAWLSLDERDRDPARFLTYLIAALQTVMPDIGEGLLAAFQSRQSPPNTAMLTTLINEIAATADEFALVLDDYHVLDARPIDDLITFLLEHLPPHMHIVIASREDPPLPLARLRARDQMTELRIADLRFTTTEAAEFLNEVMGLALSAEDVAVLETRTEGWIAGLQLAAISMEGRTDVDSFIRAFTGSHRYVLDYLVEEVLQRQPNYVRDFLLQTSILDRLNASLCDTVTGRDDSGEILARLERGNMLIVPLDEQRQWYRYHHLFADVLQTRLLEEQPAQTGILHRRASVWYEQHDLRADAIYHALAVEDFARAGSLIEWVWPAMRSSRQEATVQGWVKSLPDDLIQARPVLSVVCAWALLDGGELDAAEARLRDAEHWLDRTAGGDASPEMIVIDERQFRSLPAAIANARAYRAQALDDVDGTITYTRQALGLLPEDDYYERGTTTALLGLAYWASGDLEAAQHAFADGLASLQKGGGILIMIGGTVVLAQIQKAQGRLHDALDSYKRALGLATVQGEPPRQGTAELYLGWG